MRAAAALVRNCPPHFSWNQLGETAENLGQDSGVWECPMQTFLNLPSRSLKFSPLQKQVLVTSVQGQQLITLPSVF